MLRFVAYAKQRDMFCLMISDLDNREQKQSLSEPGTRITCKELKQPPNTPSRPQKVEPFTETEENCPGILPSVSTMTHLCSPAGFIPSAVCLYKKTQACVAVKIHFIVLLFMMLHCQGVIPVLDGVCLSPSGPSCSLSL